MRVAVERRLSVKIINIYERLLAAFGPQGWWPLLECDGCNPTKTGSVQGYHPGDYAYPKSERQRFEICVGAILAQNTNWTVVERALRNLAELDALSPDAVLSLSDAALKAAIRPAGYFNQKARKLQGFAVFFASLVGRTPSRDELLSLWGIGPETADSILCYAFHQPIVVVDAYAKRVIARLGLCEDDISYHSLQELFHSSLERSHSVRNEFHALLVELAKRHCLKREPRCEGCPLLELCDYGNSRTGRNGGRFPPRATASTH